MNSTSTQSKKRILAVSSGGGHWAELIRLYPAFADHDLTFVVATPKQLSTMYEDDHILQGKTIFRINDANRGDKIGLVKMLWQLIPILIRIRPQIIISTGAAVGFLAIFLGKLIRAKTIWIDSLANAEELSLSGKLVGKYTDLWLTQWPHLQTKQGPFYRGDVL